MAETTMHHVIVSQERGIICSGTDDARASQIKEHEKQKGGKVVAKSFFTEKGLDEFKARAIEDSMFCPWIECQGESCICNK